MWKSINYGCQIQREGAITAVEINVNKKCTLKDKQSEV